MKFSFVQRFLVVLFLFVGMTATVFTLLVVSQNGAINFSEQEYIGNAYQKPLEKTLYQIMQHRILAQRGLNGDKESLDKLSKIQEHIAVALVELESTDNQNGETLQFTNTGLAVRKREHFTVKNITKEWNELKEKVSTLTAAESSEKHSHLIADIRTMITHAGDTSNLILDPDLDSYYLMDITLLALPQSQERIQNVIAEMEPIIRAAKYTPEERVKASVFVAMMNESDIARIAGDFQTILNEDPHFYGKSETLEPKLTLGNENFVNAYKALVTLVGEASEGKTVDPEKFVQVSDEALAASFKYWDISVAELDQLLLKRIEALKSGRAKTAIVSLLCLVVGFIVSFFFIGFLVKNMRGFVNVLRQSSQQMAGASSESASSATQLSEAATEQAASLQQTMATIEQISAMVSQNADSANKTKDAVDANRIVADSGAKGVGEMLSAISEIKDTNDKILREMESSNREFAEIVRIISEIGQKTNVINEIVFQTKLLSFNASVEAARAGEHGKGFAVVAEEVGNLAQMSGNAAKEITDMLASSIKKVNQIVENTKKRVDELLEIGKDKIAMGESTAHRCRDALNKVNENARVMADMIAEITKASKEQAQGVQEITKAVSQLDQVTQQNSFVAQKSSSQAEELSGEARTLSQAVDELVLFVDGARRQEVTQEHSVVKKTIKPEKKVVESRPSVAKAADSKTSLAKVVQLKPKPKPTTTPAKKAKSPAMEQPVKKAVGQLETPSADDPNFEEF